LTVGEVDKVFSAVPDLTNQQFKAWYCKAIYQLGPHRFLELASQARKGKQPALLFSALLKSHLSLRSISCKGPEGRHQHAVEGPTQGRDLLFADE
jgi:hypothetical protein